MDPLFGWNDPHRHAEVVSGDSQLFDEFADDASYFFSRGSLIICRL
nr:hypothetical protein [Halorientalis regularis]